MRREEKAHPGVVTIRGKGWTGSENARPRRRPTRVRIRGSAPGLRRGEQTVHSDGRPAKGSDGASRRRLGGADGRDRGRGSGGPGLRGARRGRGSVGVGGPGLRRARRAGLRRAWAGLWRAGGRDSVGPGGRGSDGPAGRAPTGVGRALAGRGSVGVGGVGGPGRCRARRVGVRPGRPVLPRLFCRRRPGRVRRPSPGRDAAR
jgi:hypothetical protein